MIIFCFALFTNQEGIVGKMSEKDMAFLRKLRDAGILREVQEEKLDLGNGVISLPCSDGDQSHDWRMHLGGLVAKQRGEVRDHVVALNGGGALLLSPKSPLRTLAPVLPMVLLEGRNWPKWLLAVAKLFLGFIGFLFRQDWVVLANIWGAMKLKGISTVVMQLHFPCGAAGLCHMSPRKQCEHLVLAKRRLKRCFSRVRVPCFVHVDWVEEDGSRRKRTYQASTKQLAGWLRANPT